MKINEAQLEAVKSCIATFNSPHREPNKASDKLMLELAMQELSEAFEEYTNQFCAAHMTERKEPNLDDFMGELNEEVNEWNV